MRAIPILGEESLDLARAYRGVADFLLLDSHHAGDRQIGPLGCTHDWRISRRIVNVVASRPFSRVASTPKMSSTRSPQSAPRVWIPRQKQTLPTGAARISKRSDVSSTPPSSPGERRRTQLDGAIVLDNTQQSEPAL